jgi:hypothetical protein
MARHRDQRRSTTVLLEFLMHARPPRLELGLEKTDWVDEHRYHEAPTGSVSEVFRRYLDAGPKPAVAEWPQVLKIRLPSSLSRQLSIACRPSLTSRVLSPAAMAAV